MKLRRRWKVFWNLAVIFAIIVVARRWDPPFDDSDMRVPRDVAKPEENAYADYERIAGELIWPSGTRSRSFRELLRDPEQGWAAMLPLANSNRQVVAELERVMKKPRCQEPEVHNAGDTIPGVTGRMDLIRMLEICAATQLTQKNMAEAARITNIASQYAHHISQENDSLVAHLIGLSTQQIAMAMVRRQAENPSITEPHLEKLARTLMERPMVESSLETALRGEYRCMLISVEHAVQTGSLLKNALNGKSFDAPSPPNGWDRLFAPTVAWAGFLPNQTRRKLHGFTKPLLAGSSLPANDETFKDLRTQVEQFELESESPRKWLRPNVLGEAAINANIHCVAANSWRLTRNVMDLTQTFVALRRYQLQHGRYPETLDQLCPDFLNRVPIDRFDGAPIRYDAATVTVYSAWPLDERGRPVQDADLFTAAPLVKPTESNDRSVFVLPPAPGAKPSPVRQAGGQE